MRYIYANKKARSNLRAFLSLLVTYYFAYRHTSVGSYT